jgi:hypothetical protein
MPVKRTYTSSEVKSAIDMTNNQYYRKFLRVRNDVTGGEFNAAKIKTPRDASGKPVDPFAWRGRGSDVGHAFRHVRRTAPPGKSVYQDDATAVAVTVELLNSTNGQAKLAELDQENPAGDERSMEANRRIVAPVTGAYYGASDHGQPLRKIRAAVCEVMKVGESTLWIHTTYPSRFHA